MDDQRITELKQQGAFGAADDSAEG
jgi:hypothetical protein